MKSVVVLGGYGNFGRRVVAALAHEPDCRLLVAGRDARAAARLAHEAGGRAEPLRIDLHDARFPTELEHTGAALVIHTAGPFQGQDYSVPRACISAGAHYIDLADGRAFVSGIGALNDAALERGVLVVSGASTLPALSSAVIDSLATGFSRIDTIDHGITSGARPPGLATMRGVLAYAGAPFSQWKDGRWQRVWGWQGLTSRRYPGSVGQRLIAHCDVPDLELFPPRYAARTVQFRAGVAPASNMVGLWIGSWLVRLGMLRSLDAQAPLLHRAASVIARVGTKRSAMHVSLRGLDLEGSPQVRQWTLIAEQDHGPNIPCFPAIALARRILRNQTDARGAMPCMGLLTTEEILAVGAGLDLRVELDPTPAPS